MSAQLCNVAARAVDIDPEGLITGDGGSNVPASDNASEAASTGGEDMEGSSLETTVAPHMVVSNKLPEEINSYLG